MDKKEQVINQIEESKTGNRSRDRLNLIRKREAYRYRNEPFSEAILLYLNNELDSLLPANLYQFTKDMLSERMLWIEFLIDRASEVVEGYDLNRAHKLIKLAINELEKDVDASDITTPVFSVNTLYEEELIRNVLNIPTKYEIIEGPHSEAYFVLATISFMRGAEGEGINALTTANHWNPVSLPVLLYIGNYFKMRKVLDKLEMVSMLAGQIAIDPDHIGEALRLIGYSYYLRGRHKQAYCCYHESLRYGTQLDGETVNDEMNAILLALGEKEPRILTKREINELFLGEKFYPGPSQMAFATLKKIIRKTFEDGDYLQTIEYAEIHLKTKRDLEVEKLLRLAKEHLA